MLALLAFWSCLSIASALASAKICAASAQAQRSALFLAAFPPLALALWTAIVWALSFLQLLAAWSLLCSATAAVGLAYWWARPASATPGVDAFQLLAELWNDRRGIGVFWPLLPAFGFLLWKGFVLPTNNPDALYLHLPRAVWISRSGGLPLGQSFPVEWAAHAAYPLNYEGMLASILRLTGQDTYTEWFTTWTLGLACLSVCGIARAIHPALTRTQLAVAVLIFCSMPVLVLHGAADKVDIAVAVASASALFWLYWWLEREPRLSIFSLAWVSAFTAMGLKKTGLVFVALAALALLWQALRQRQGWRWLASHAGLALASGLLLGLCGTAQNLLGYSTIFGAHGTIQTYVRAPGAGLFSFDQLATYPILLNLVPFSSNRLAVFVPWRSEWWYWPATNLFFSHWGLLCNAAVLSSFVLAPFWVRRAIAGNRGMFLPLGAFAVYLFIVAKSYAYEGGFNSFPRYTLFYAIFLSVYVLVPAIVWLSSLHRWVGPGLLALASAWFCANFWYYAREDYYSSFDEAWRRWEDPELRRVIPAGARRVGAMVDRSAAANAVIATDLTYMTWIHPLYGADLGRIVHILHLETDGHFAIPDDAEWIMADNIANVVWGLNQVPKTAGEQLRAFQHGLPSERDTALYRQLVDDPRFALLYVDGGGNQAVFRRLAPRPTR